MADNPVTLVKSFSPTTIQVGGTSVLTIVLTNPPDNIFPGNGNFIDNLPVGLVVAPLPNGMASGAGTIGTITAVP